MSAKPTISLGEFVKKWNEGGNGITFTLVQGASSRPSSVEVRFSTSRYLRLYFLDQFPELVEEIDQRSHHTMLVSTNEEMFLRGVLDIKIASESHHYSEMLVKRVLEWIGEAAIPSQLNLCTLQNGMENTERKDDHV